MCERERVKQRKRERERQRQRVISNLVFYSSQHYGFIRATRQREAETERRRQRDETVVMVEAVLGKVYTTE